MTSVRRGVAAARSLVGVALLGLAVPLMLIRLSWARFDSASPLAGLRPPWRWDRDDVDDAVRRPLEDDTVVDLIIRAGLLVAWLALSVIVAATVLEVAHLIRHRGLPSPRRRGLRWTQPLAHALAIGIVALLPVASKVTAAQTLTPVSSGLAERAALSMATATVGDPGEVDGFGGEHALHPDSVVVGSGERVHVVARGESVWSIAERLSDGSEPDTLRVSERILDRNLGSAMSDGSTFSSPALIQPGWELIVPDLRPGTPAADAATLIDAGVTGTHVVKAGDSLSSIAEEHLGDGLRWTEIAEANLGDRMNDSRTFDDPNLILPGWELELSDAADEPETAEETSLEVGESDERGTDDVGREADGEEGPSVDPSVVNDERDADPVVEESAASDEDDWFDTDPAPATTAPATEPVMRGETTAVGPPAAPGVSTTTTPSFSSPDGEGGSTGEEPTTPVVPTPLGIEQAAMLAGGVLTLAAVRRRRRLRAARARSRAPEPHPSVVDTTRTLTALDRAERAARFSVAARALAHHLVDTGVRPGAFLHGTDGTIEVVLTGRAELSAPWIRTATGWELPASTPIELLSADARNIGLPCPALVAVGMVGDVELLVDLEAAGVVAIDAPETNASSVLAALAVTFATSLDGETAHLFTVGIDPSVTFDHPNAVPVDDLAEALQRAGATIGSAARAGQRLFDLRTRRTGGEDWEPAVVFCGPGVDVDGVQGDSDRRGECGAVPDGVAVVGHASLVDDPDDGRCGVRLICDSTGWRLDGFGWEVSFTPFGLDARSLVELHEVIVAAEAKPVAEGEPLLDEVDDAEVAAAAAVAAETPVERELQPEAGAEAAEQGGDDVTADSDLDDSLVALDDASRGSVDAVDISEPLDYTVVVRLFGGVAITDRDGEGRSWHRSKTVELIAWLATHRRRPTRSAARTAMWAENVRDATFSNVVSEARRGLADLVEPPEGVEWIPRTLTDELPLHELVVTDLDLVRDRLDAATVASPAQAVEVLRPMLDFIGGLPFADTNYLWPDADGLVTDATLAATSLCTELAEHALSLADIELVYESTAHGLLVLPGHEDLIGLRMRAHAAAGDLAAVRQEWESYERVLNADAWSDGEPAPALVELRRELLSR